MSAAAKLAGFAVLLGALFGAAVHAGAAIDPTADGETEPAPHAGAGAGHDEGGDRELALELRSDSLPTGPSRLELRVVGGNGGTVRDGFEREHEKRLHLILVRQDTAVFVHAHPEQAGDGSWVADLDLDEPGPYRVFADFRLDGEDRTLSADLFVPGDFRPVPWPEPAPRSPALGADGSPTGLKVELSAEAHAGRESRLEFAVSRDGRPFTAIEPYLGADGHLVALREGDLAYQHVHPLPGEGGEIAFAAGFPTPGRYRLFLQFRAEGAVRTAPFTIEVAP